MDKKCGWGASGMRLAGCAALLALLAVSSYAGAKRLEVPDVPIVIETVSAQVAAMDTIGQTQARLASGRGQALALLQSVLEDPQADEASRRQALAEKTRIASRMETEAAVHALLEYMGFSDTAVVAGESALNIIAPWQTAENEHNRVRMIDAAVSTSGFSAEAVKIILAKK